MEIKNSKLSTFSFDFGHFNLGFFFFNFPFGTAFVSEACLKMLSMHCSKVWKSMLLFSNKLIKSDSEAFIIL